MDDQQEQTHPEVGEDATQYGEFISSYFAWISLPDQKKKAEKMADVTKNDKRDRVSQRREEVKMVYKFTNKAKKVIEIANDISIELGHNYIGTEHILYGLVEEGEGIAAKVLTNKGVTEDKVKVKIEELLGRGQEIKESLGFTPRTKRVLENAFLEAKRIGYNFIGTEHLLLAIMKEGDCVATQVIIELNVDIPKIYNEIAKVINEEESDKEFGKDIPRVRGSFSSTTTLNQFGEDITLQAEEGKFDNIIGREKEIERIIQILSRRTKNNPCLIGEPGVGKTAIVEGLAEKIIYGEVPESLKDKRIVSIDISGMVAGAKYRGDFEDRIKKALNEVKKVGDVILFIDEIHTIVGAGAAEGAIDAANILKPLLARGEIQLIGATTIEEYRKYIEKDSALERRFSPVDVDEPTPNQTVEIIKGIRDKYEAHHNVKITDEAIKSAVDLSIRYITDRFLPDKAIDLIDEAASQVRMKIFTEPDEIKKFEEMLDIAIKEKEDAIYNQEFEKAAQLRDKQKQIEETLEKELNKWKKRKNKNITEITEENIAEIISKWTGIPVQKLTQDENEKLKHLEEKLHERVIGQNEAVEAVAKAIRRGRVGLKDPKRPIGSFLFLGPTGVGKTELSKALAEILFENENAMIRIDMSEYMEAHSVSKLIGSPPGYIGFDGGGQLTEKIRRKPYSVVLFDEIEKAHPDVTNLLLQILEDGRLTDSQGREVNFKNTVIIMTSNLGARHITEKKSLGFGGSSIESEKEQNKEDEETKKEVIKELKRELRPEFINRIDEIIVFHKLNDENIKEIAQIMLKQVEERLKQQKYIVEIDSTVIEQILEQGIDKNFGARPLRRTIQNLVEDRISEEILEGNLQKNKKWVLNSKKGS